LRGEREGRKDYLKGGRYGNPRGEKNTREKKKGVKKEGMIGGPSYKRRGFMKKRH